MAINPTLDKYILNEIWPTFFTSLFVVAFIVVATKMLTLTEMVISKGVPVSQIIRMVTYLLPDITTFALPAATLLAVVLAFLRLSGDSEIIAIKSCGISLYQMLPPVVLISSLAMLFALTISIIGIPWGNNSFKKVLYQIAASNAAMGIKERIFCEPFPGVVFYVNSYSEQTNAMERVFVVDNRESDVTNTIIANSGKIFFHSQKNIITLRFKNGVIFVVENDLETGRTIKFKTYDLNISLEDYTTKFLKRKKDPKELPVNKIIEQLKTLPKKTTRYNKLMIELMEKGSIPLAVFLMGIIGMPLGAQLKSRGRSAGIGVSLFIFLIYYLCLAGVKSICEKGILHPVIGVWSPVMFLLIACIFIFRRVANEQTINPLSGIIKIRRED